MSEELVLRGHHTDYDGLDDIVDWIMELHNLWDDKSISMEDRISARKLMLAEEKLLLLALGYTPWEMEKESASDTMHLFVSSYAKQVKVVQYHRTKNNEGKTYHVYDTGDILRTCS